MTEPPPITARGGEVCGIVVSSLERELAAQGAMVPPVRVRLVASMPNVAMDKAPLVPQPEEH